MDPTKVRANLGNVIRARRERLGYSQESFADRVGVDRTYMGFVERGEKNMTLRNLVRIANALGVRGSELLAEAEKAVKPESPRR